MSDPGPGTERTYRIDDGWSRAVFARRTGDVAAFLAPHLRAGMPNHVIRLHGVLGELAVTQGWATWQELDRMAEVLSVWGEAPDAFYTRPAFTAIGWPEPELRPENRS